MAAVGEEQVTVAAHGAQVPVGGGAAPGVVDLVVMYLQHGRGPAARSHAGVAVSLQDGSHHLGGNVAAVVVDPGDVDTVGGHDLGEGAGQDGPDGLVHGHGRPACLAHPALAPQP